MGVQREVDVGNGRAVTVEQAVEQWRVSLFDCCHGGCGGFCYPLFCGPCASATALTRVNHSDWCFNCLCVAGAAPYRNIVREAYHIEGDCCTDILVALFCAPCSACQNYNETQVRGTANLTFSARAPTVQPWRAPLCGCCDNCTNCLLGFFLAPCANARARTNFDGSNCCFNLMCMHSCVIRSIIRNGYNLEGGCFGDMCFPIFCPFCVAAQHLNEVDSRGKITKSTMVVPSESMQR